MHYRHATKLRQRDLQPVINGGSSPLAVAHRIPLVRPDHHSAAFLGNQAGDCQILLVNLLGGIDKKNAQMRKLDGAKRIINHQLLDLVADPRTPPHSSCIDQLVGASLPGEGQFYGIAGNPRFRAGQKPVFTQQPVDQGRFAHIRAADNSNAHWQG